MIAQAQTGFHSLGELKGWWLQAAWTLSGLVVCCLLAAGFRDQASDREQLRAVLVTSVAMLLLLLSDIKNGTGLNVTVPVEAVLVPGAVSGLVDFRLGGRHAAWRGAQALGAATQRFWHGVLRRRRAQHDG